MTIIEMRTYARVKEELKRAKKQGEEPDSPMVDRVFEVKKELMRRQRADGQRG